MDAAASESLPLHLDQYQTQAALTARNPKQGTAGIHFALLGLFGEVGSVLSELKKKQRDQDSYFAYRASITEEFGDALWYFANVASRAVLKLSAIGQRALRTLGDWDKPTPNGSISFEELQAGVEFSGPLVDDTVEAGLIGLAGKVGRLLDDVASGRIDGNRDALSAHLVEVFRALIRAANDAGISLSDCARKNLEKTSGRWAPTIREYAPLFDETEDTEEQLPRHIEIDIMERTSGKKTYVRLQCQGINIGDHLTDNKIEQDDYRFHDVFHLGYAAILGWSPVIRALFRVKRKSKPLIDETQDGARAILIEEAVATWVFNHACRLNYFASISSLDYSLLKAIKELVADYEVERIPLWQWEEAILKGYEVFRPLQEHRRGVVIADLNTHTLSFKMT
ncbi:MAG: nucleoside triphosphate pyrophosphohydrolase family protein [Acidobacteriia bacterium]|nr:nucleoside triphosphate pyrophosphohydrolase family protein [Terriglobia bacterium]